MARVPGWYKFTWFLGTPPNLTQRQWKLLGLVAAVSVFEQYDIYLFSLNLKQIQADLAIAESDLGLLSALVRSGAFIAIFLTIAADRFGRRIMLLATVVGYTLFTGATAFSPTAELFIVFQFFARGFATAELLIAAVVIAEEFAPEHRGWGIGALSALQALGAGLAAIMFGFVEYFPFGWRFLYAFGLIPLLLIAYWRRTLPETSRYQQIERTREPLRKSLGALLSVQPRRTWGLLLATFWFGVAASSASFFAPKYLQDVYAWTPSDIAILNLMGGALAIIGNPLAGWLSDRYGRRPVTVIFMTFFALCTLLFYGVIGVVVPILWIGLIFFVMGSDVTLTSYSTELFPTRYRSTASGVKGMVAAIAATLGLSAVSGLYVIFGSNWTAIAVLAGVSLLAPLIVWLLLPETARRTLEDISPDK